MSGRQEAAIVTVHCSRCGRSFLMRVEPLRVGYAVDVETVGCDCALDEDEYEALADRAVGAYERGERGGMVQPPFRPGERVRCLVSTATYPGMPELRGRAGRVLAISRVRAQPGDPNPTGWLVSVVWSGIRPRTPWFHAADKLARAP